MDKEEDPLIKGVIDLAAEKLGLKSLIQLAYNVYTNRVVVLKVVNERSGFIPFLGMDAFKIMYPDMNIFYQRVIDNYRLFSILNIGAKFITFYIIDNSLVIVTEYLPRKLTPEIADAGESKIRDWIISIHKLGIYHGDLHGGNVMLTSNGDLKLIDLESVFYKDELNTQMIQEFAYMWYNTSVEGLIEAEEVDKFKTFPD